MNTSPDLNVKVATTTRRFVAMLLDSLVPATLALSTWASLEAVPINPQWNLFDQAVDLVNAQPEIALYPTGIFALSVVFWHLVTCTLWQTSPGKRLIGLRCVDRTGQPPGFGRLCLHGLLRLVSLSLLGLGHLWAIIDRQRMTMYDRLAGVITVLDEGGRRDESERAG